jgi:hypothetical protein
MLICVFALYHARRCPQLGLLLPCLPVFCMYEIIPNVSTILFEYFIEQPLLELQL